jgi:hypothetical protein
MIEDLDVFGILSQHQVIDGLIALESVGLIISKNNEYFTINKQTDNDKKTCKSKNEFYIYVMKNLRNGFYKIGISHNPTTREKTLQSEEPEIELLFYSKGSYKHEKQLHQTFIEKRVRGEWFSLDDNDIENIKSYLGSLYE